MECAICYDAITAATGKVELSCSHSFHINCLTTWFVTLNVTQRTQVCPYCRHESSEHEVIPTTITSAVDIHDIYRELMSIHLTIEQGLRAEILLLTQNLSHEMSRAVAAEDWAAAAEEAANNAHDALYDYKVAKRSEDVAVKKRENRENWAKWTGAATGVATGAAIATRAVGNIK